MACRLTWTVPPTVEALPSRDARVAAISEAVRATMVEPGIDTAPYAALLALLEKRTSPAWRHLFMTTNCDTLLDREVNAKCQVAAPPWLTSTFVFHLNGRALDTMPDPERRSAILLETDSESDRAKSQEYEQAKAYLKWAHTVIEAGMSFTCETDRALLDRLGLEPLPIECARWIVVDSDASTLGRVCATIRSRFPGAEVRAGARDFASWVEGGLSELGEGGILNPPKSKSTSARATPTTATRQSSGARAQNWPKIRAPARSLAAP
jgi:hypothetical protein